MRESCADIDKVTSKRNQKGKCDDMKLTLAGLKDTAAWQAAGIKLPSYDVEKLAENTRKAPVWVHFGAGNILDVYKRQTDK